MRKADWVERRQTGGLVVHRPGLAAADVEDELGDALDVLHRQRRVDAALEAMPGVGVEVEAARAARHGFGPPERSFDVDVARGIRHRGGVAAHDAGQRFDRVLIGDHAHLVVELDRVAVQQLELFADAAPANAQAPMDLVQVEHVARPAELEHHIVGDVHERAHRALAAAREPVDHPGRRGRLRIHVADDAAGEAPAQIGRFDLHRQRVAMRWLDRRVTRRVQRRAGQGGDLARDAEHAQAMRQVRREFEREDVVVELQVGAHVLAHGRVVGQDEQAAVVVRQFELARRAEHALAFHAAQLAEFDLEAFAVGLRRQRGADHRTRHLDSRAHIGRAAHDVQARARSCIDLAYAQAVGVRVARDFEHLRDDDTGERRRGRARLFHFHARHREQLGQLGAAEVGVAELAQPGFGELHGGLWRVSQIATGSASRLRRTGASR